MAIDLLNPPEFETVKKYGLACSMVSFPVIDGLGGITKAFNRVEHHDKLTQALILSGSRKRPTRATSV